MKKPLGCHYQVCYPILPGEKVQQENTYSCYLLLHIRFHKKMDQYWHYLTVIANVKPALKRSNSLKSVLTYLRYLGSQFPP